MTHVVFIARHKLRVAFVENRQVGFAGEEVLRERFDRRGDRGGGAFDRLGRLFLSEFELQRKVLRADLRVLRLFDLDVYVKNEKGRTSSSSRREDREEFNRTCSLSLSASCFVKFAIVSFSVSISFCCPVTEQFTTAQLLAGSVRLSISLSLELSSRSTEERYLKFTELRYPTVRNSQRSSGSASVTPANPFPRRRIFHLGMRVDTNSDRIIAALLSDSLL